MATDGLFAIENFFSGGSSDVIKVGDPDAVKKFYDKIKRDYNLEEMQSVLDCDDNMLIVSSAGSGKTTTLILKIIRDYLAGKFRKKTIVNGVEVETTGNILVSTFLKSGAVELSDKLNKLVKEYNIQGIDTSRISFRTIHSEVYNALVQMGVKPNIVPESDTYKYIKKACKDYNIHSVMGGKSKELTKEEIPDIACILTYSRNRLDNTKFEHPLMAEYGMGEIELKAILEEFKLLKAVDKVQDFEDLEEILYDAYDKFPNVIDFIKSRYDYVYLDEFQDTSQLQYAILKPYLESARGFVAVGDDDQCFPCNFNVLTNLDKSVEIKKIQKGHNVLSFLGDDKVMQKKVNFVSKKNIDTDLIRVETKSGKVLIGTKNHILFTKLLPLHKINTVYLMYREEFGFRIGQTSGVRQGGKGEKRIGIAQRLNREKGDRIWILKECNTKQEAIYWENYYSEKYEIPKYMFKIEKQYKVTKNQKEVLKMYNDLETTKKGFILLSDFGFDFNYPHFIPKVREDKCALYFTMFGGYSYGSNGVKKSRITVDTTNEEYADVMREHLYVCQKHPKNRKPYWCCTSTSVNIDLQEKLIKDIVADCKDKGLPLIVRKRIKIAGETYDFMPFSNLIKGMVIPILKDGQFIEDEIVNVSEVKYQGMVYDLSIPETRVYCVESTLVHNCIYGWRGSDVSLIQEKFEKDFKPVIKKLSVNRRCKENILNPIIPSIEENTSRHKKELKASQKGGEVTVVVDGGASYLMKSIREDLMRSEDVGILGRTNADLLIPALLLELDGYSSFSLSKSVSLSDRIPSQVIGIMDLITQRYNEKFEGYFKLFLNKYNSYEATKLCDVLSTTPEYSIYNIDLEDLEYSAPSLFGVIRMLRREVPTDPVGAYVQLLEIMEQDVYNGKTIYAQRARDFTYYMRKIIQEHERIKDLTIDELYHLFHVEIANSLEKKKPQQPTRVQKADGSWVTERPPQDNSYVRITTVHDAKGKQWANVYIWNDVDGCFPNTVGNRPLTKEEFEEERRVHYIAWTRAVNKLTVFTRSDRLDGFLKECDLSNVNVVEVNENKKLTKQNVKKSAEELLKGTETTRKVEPKKEVVKDWVWYFKEYVKKYTSYSYICTPKGSNLDICLTKFNGIQNLVEKLREYHLEAYPISDLDDVISDILESLVE